MQGWLDSDNNQDKYCFITKYWDINVEIIGILYNITFCGLFFFQVADKKGNEALKEWVPDITNHFWYCCSKANGEEIEFMVRKLHIVHMSLYLLGIK